MDRKIIKISFVIGLIIGVGFVSAASWGIYVDSGVTLDKESGPQVKILTDDRANLTDPFGTDSVVWNTSNGRARFTSSGNTEISVSQIEGTYTRTQDVDTRDKELTINPADKSPIIVNGSPSVFEFADAGINNNQVDLVMTSQSATNVTFTGLSAVDETVYLAADGSITAASTSNQSGAVTFRDLAASSSTQYVLIQSNNNYSVNNTPVAPTVDNSSASPTNYTNVGNETPTLRINISDGDFPDDELTVVWYRDGQQLATHTYFENTTATLNYTEPIAGNHSWSVRVVDDYTLENRSDTFWFQTPNDLDVADEESNQTLSNVSVSIRYFFKETAEEDPLIVERESTGGTINMSGLPANRDFVAVARADGWVNRRVWVSSLYEQDRIWLLNESADYVTTTFRLRDYSGNFPPDETVLQVQGPINESWKTVEGDYFGGTGKFDSHLRRNVRHRLVLINAETGDRRVLGHFTPTRDGAEHIIEITQRGEISIIDEGPYAGFRPGTGSLPATNATTSTVEIQPMEKNMSQYNVTWILNRTSENGTLRRLSGSQRDGETLTTDLNLTGEVGSEVIVVVEWTTEDGESGTFSKVYGIRESYQHEHSLFEAIAGITASLTNPGLWTSFVSLFGSVLFGGIVASRLRLSSEGIGLVVIAALVGFGLLGWIGWPVPLIAGLVWIVASGLRRGL